MIVVTLFIVRMAEKKYETCIICLMGGLSVSYGVFVDEDRGKLLTLYWLP